MGYCVVHMQKMKMSASGGIQSHLNREHESRTNADIDYERSKDNYDIIPTSNLREDIKLTIEDIVQPKKAVRKDAVVCCNFIITSDNETMNSLDPQELKNFFEDSVAFFAQRYGFEKIMYATVHMDETTPHMHLGLVPITKDNRLSAKTLFTPLELKELQTKFYEEVGKKYGLERGLEGSTNKHIETQRFKKETLDKEIKETKKEIFEMRNKLSQAKEVSENFRSAHQKVEKEIHDKLCYLDDLDNAIAKKEFELSGKVRSMSELRERIQEAKTHREETQLFSMLKKFIELPAVKPLWQKFLEQQKLFTRRKTVQKAFENTTVRNSSNKEWER